MHEPLAVLVHLMRKDWRYVRLRALVCWGLAMMSWAWLAVPSVYEMGTLHLALATLVPLLVLVQLIQVDPPSGTTAFWPTRPLGGGVVLASKLLVGFGTVILPCALLNQVPLVLHRIELTAGDYAIAFTSHVLRWLLAIWVALVAASVTRRIAESLAVAALFIGLLFLAITGVEKLWPKPAAFEAASFAAVWPVFAVAQGLLVLYALYRTRRTSSAVGALVLTGVMLLGLYRTWSWDVLASLRAGETASPSAVKPLDEPVALRLGPRPLLRYSRVGSAGVIETYVDVQGLPPGVSLLQTGSSMRVTQDGQTTRHDHVVDPRSPSVFATSFYDPAIPARAHAALGCPATPTDPPGKPTAFGRIELLRAEGRSPLDTTRPYSLDGTIRFDVVRATVDQRASALGGAFSLRGGRLVSRRAPESEAAAGFVVQVETFSVVPLPWPATRAMLPPTFFDPESGQCLWASESSAGPKLGPPFLPLVIGERRYSQWAAMTRRHEPSTGPIPLSTEMVLLGSETIGAIELPFTYAPSVSAKAGS